MTMSNETKSDLKNYGRWTIWSASILLAMLVIFLVIAFLFKKTVLMSTIVGAMIGVMVSTVNLFSLGYAFFKLVIARKSRKWVVLWPFFTFIFMCVLAYIFAVYFEALILGFALGLTVPVIFGSVIVFLSKKPA